MTDAYPGGIGWESQITCPPYSSDLRPGLARPITYLTIMKQKSMVKLEASCGSNKIIKYPAFMAGGISCNASQHIRRSELPQKNNLVDRAIIDGVGCP